MGQNIIVTEDLLRGIYWAPYLKMTYLIICTELLGA